MGEFHNTKKHTSLTNTLRETRQQMSKLREPVNRKRERVRINTVGILRDGLISEIS